MAFGYGRACFDLTFIDMPSYRWCIVPMCTNTSIKTPEKIFLNVPKDSTRRIKWLKASKRDEKQWPGPKTTLWCCQDHFNMEEDIENFMRFKMMGGNLQSKKDAVPHIFKCQHQRAVSSTAVPKPRLAASKRLVSDALNSHQHEAIHSGQSDVVMKLESHRTVGPVMIGEEDLNDNPGVSVMKEEVLSEDDTHVGDTSASVENDDKCSETVETKEISFTKHEPCWSDWGVQDIEISEKTLFSDREEEQSDLPVTEGAPEYSDILKLEFVDPEFVCMDSGGMGARDETNKQYVDPLADADDEKPYYTTSKHEFQEWSSDQHSIDTCSKNSRSRNFVNGPLADVCNEKKPCSSSTANINTSREHSPDTVADHLPDLHTPHQCETCARTFMTKRLLSTHVKSHWNKCDKCGRRFKTHSRLLAHIKNDCSHLLPLECESCGKTYKCRGSLLEHMKYNCGRQVPQIRASCGETFEHRSPLVTHLKHGWDHQEQYKCESCGKTYKLKRSLWHHMKYSCGRNEPHKCESCGKTYKQIDNLKKHIKYDCGRLEPHKCESCGKTFNDNASFLYHLKYVCGRLTSHKCKSCGKTYKYSSSIKYHIKYGCDHQEQYKCESCGKTYKLKCSLSHHMKYSCGRNEPHKCESCGKTYKLKCTLSHHMKYSCGRNEPHKCESCGKTYKHIDNLTKHIKYDCGRLEPHKCESCGKTYKLKGSLWHHMKYSCGRNEPHKCESCGKTYKNIVSLRKHIKYDYGRLEPHKCDSCGKTFKHIKSLKRHLTNMSHVVRGSK